MKEISTVQVLGNEILQEQKQTIGVDLGDRWSFYCVLDEAGKIILEQKVATTPEAMKQTFAKIPRSLIALETGTHSPWASRLLTELGHEVLVAHAQKVELITKSNRKDDRRDARALAGLARMDPELLGPVRHRRAQAQIHLTVIRARAELVSARTALGNAARGLVKSYGQREPEVSRGIKHRVARGSGAAAPRNRITERAHPGVRRADGENRPEGVPGSVLAQAGEGCGNPDRADLCPDDRGPVSLREESRGGLFSGIKTWTQELWEQRATEENQQRRRPLSAHHDGAGGALHSGAVWRRQ
jgi:hypothetical protein